MLREIKGGFVELINNFKIPFRFNRALRYRCVREPKDIVFINKQDKTTVYISASYRDNFYDFIPGMGRIRRPALLTFGRIIKHLPVVSSYFVSFLRAGVPDEDIEQDIKIQVDTDIYLTTGGIGRYYGTDTACVVQTIHGRSAGQRTAWDEF